MSLAKQMLTAAFPDLKVSTVQRPDGGLLLTLHDQDGEVLRRALSFRQVGSATELEWVISSIRRDLALEAGLAPSIARLQSQSRSALPTYETY